LSQQTASAHTPLEHSCPLAHVVPLAFLATQFPEAQYELMSQSWSLAQLDVHAPPAHTKGAQATMPVSQWPAPLQRRPCTEPPKHEVGPHVVPAR
jgi:hypothetical protein